MEESIRMTEDRDKWRKYVEVLPTLGSRTAKDQIRSGRWLITIGAEDNLVRIIGKNIITHTHYQLELRVL